MDLVSVMKSVGMSDDDIRDAVRDDNRSACCGAPLRLEFPDEHNTQHRCSRCGLLQETR